MRENVRKKRGSEGTTLRTRRGNTRAAHARSARRAQPTKAPVKVRLPKQPSIVKPISLPSEVENTTFLVWGNGKFVRLFLGLFTEQGLFDGSQLPPGAITTVQRFNDGRNLLFNLRRQYNAYIRTADPSDDQIVKVSSIGHMLVSSTEWSLLIDLACSEQVKWFVTNLGERAYEDFNSDPPPANLLIDRPAKVIQQLLCCLMARYRRGLNPLNIIPFELYVDNGPKLKWALMTILEHWGQKDPKNWKDKQFADWLDKCFFWSSLVDQLVPDPEDLSLVGLFPEFNTDRLGLVTESYRRLYLQRPDGAPYFLEHPNIKYVASATPFAIEKIGLFNAVRILMIVLFRANLRKRGKKPEIGNSVLMSDLFTDPVRAQYIGHWCWHQLKFSEHRSIYDLAMEILYEELIPAMPPMVLNPKQFANIALARTSDNPRASSSVGKVAGDRATYMEKVRSRLGIPLQLAHLRSGKYPPLLTKVLRAEGIVPSKLPPYINFEF